MSGIRKSNNFKKHKMRKFGFNKISILFWWQNTLNDCWKVSLYDDVWQQSISSDKRQSLTQVTVTCTIAGAWGKLTYQPCVLHHFTATSHKRPKKDIKMGEHKGSKSQTLNLTNFNNSLYFHMNKSTTSGWQNFGNLFQNIAWCA